MQQANPSLADLRARRAALNARLAKGLDALRSKEDAGDTGPEYQQWLSAWLGLLAEYQVLCEQIAARRAQAPTPPMPSAAPAPPAAWPVDRQLALFAPANPYGRGV
jgi:hypothetical protein